MIPNKGLDWDCSIQSPEHTENHYTLNYHLCNKTSPPSLCAVHVYVVMLHTMSGRSQQSPLLVSSAVTRDIPFQTIGRELYLFLQYLDYWPQGDAQALSNLLQFHQLNLLIHHLWVFPLFLQREIIQYQEIIKAREWIPHIGPLTIVILLNYF